MTSKKLVKDNLIMFIGGNVANALNYFLNLALFRIDDTLLNLYTTYTSVSLLLLIPSQVSLRTFTVFGNPIVENLRRYYLRNKNLVLSLLIVLALMLLPANIILTRITQSGKTVTSVLLILLALIGVVSYVFRGIRQHDEDYRTAAISLNIEAVSRLVLGLLFSVYLKMGISGILIAHIIGLIGSLIVCFDKEQFRSTLKHNDEVRLKNLFVNTFWLTAGLEFFANFDIIYSAHILNPENLAPPPPAQTQFNTLQFFRKIIFFGSFTVSSIILSIGGKGHKTKQFMFMYTMVVGLIIGVGSSIFFILLKKPILSILQKDLTLISNLQLVQFLAATTFMSTSYLLANWLYTLKKTNFIFLPMIASITQFTLYILFAKDLISMLNIFFITSTIFFVLTFGAGIYELLIKNKSIEIENE
jgi:hypothetical protein